jgi:diguanylate cyclase (GGDEF)-like protein
VAAPTGDTVTETTLKETDPDIRNLLAVVTTIVILFITAISIATVRSVLTPVHRILRATAQLASGDMRVEVSRGGIRELDTLASAFNEMAAKLSAAQALSRYQQDSLEETVLERTHKLQQLALQDPLTSLPNRRHLSALLNAAIDRASADDRYIGVYFIDIDNFKNFNDSLGHAFGDRVLMSVANRLEEFADGLGFVARLGGDEFTLVYESAMSVEAIHATGMNLVDAFHELVSVDDRELSISVSVGASIFPEHGWDAEGLLRAADSALFRAKELGRSQLAVFTPELIKTAATRFMIEQGLRRAIEGSEFELAYQPEINLATSEMELVEALLRWRMPDGRLAKPGEFLAVAEQSGLISEINSWVLRTAVEDASRWYHGEWPDVCVAINISPRQLLDHRFIEQILALLLEFRLPAHCIEFELTEMALQTGSTTIAALRVLHSHGFGIALDDFGTGYSSLTSLERLPLSRIKLDRSLVASIDTSARSAAIARAIIDLCGGLGLQVTAEGIERPQQFAWLLDNRAMFLQGYLLSDAVPFVDVLPVKASLANRIQDLLLSLPAPPRRHVPEPIDALSMVNL